MSKKRASSHNNGCCFCGLAEDNEVKYGRMYTHDKIMTHYYCLLLSSNMEQRGKDNEGILGFLSEDIHKEIRRGKKLMCKYCKKYGATLGCCNTKCKKKFHFPCGIKAGALNQFFGEFKSFCGSHRLNQKIDRNVEQEVKNLNEVLCCICYDQVNPHDSACTLWAPCCKKAWFHKECVQQLAVSAGYFFKCPLCNNKKKFQKEMLENGIFIPHQDASWELVPNAYQELLYRHNSCDAEECLCPKGRTHTSNNSKWELILCRTCGSQGMHMGCGELKWGNRSLWECKECSFILNKSKQGTSSEAATDVTHNSSDACSDDSDTDVSVGTESPIPSNSSGTQRHILSPSPVKLQPGPKSYKIRQLLELNLGNIIRIHNTENSAKINANDVSKSQSSMLRSMLINKDDSEHNVTDQQIMNIKQSQSPLKNDIITIDSDDDIIDVTPPLKQKDYEKWNANSEMRNSTRFTHVEQQIKESAVNETCSLSDVESEQADNDLNGSHNSSPICNIKISNVTSLPHEVFKKVPDAFSDMLDTDTEYSNELTNFTCCNTTGSETMLKRKTSLLLTTPTRNRIKRVRSEDFNRVTTPDLIDSPCSGSQSLPAAFAPRSQSPISLDLECTDETMDEIIGEATNSTHQKHDLRTPFTNEDTYTSGDIEYCESIFENILPTSSVSSTFVEVAENNEYSDDNPFEETLCEMNPLVMEEEGEEASVRPASGVYSPTTSSQNRTHVGKLLNERNVEFIGTDTSDGPINSCTDSETNGRLSRTETQGSKCFSQMHVNSIADCHKDADTSLLAESSNVTCSSNSAWIISANESTERLYNCSFPDSRGIPSAETSTSTWSADDAEEACFPTVRTNYNACDRLRLIPETIRLQDLKFRVCGANALQMVLYDTFCVNISTEQKTEFELHRQSATQMKQSNSEREFVMSMDKNNRSNSLDYLHNSDEKSSLFVNNQANYRSVVTVCNSDDTKENFDPIRASSPKKSFANCAGDNNYLSPKNINLFERGVSPLCEYDVTEEENYDKSLQSRQTFSSPTVEFKLNENDNQPIQRRLRSSNKEYSYNIRDGSSAQQGIDEKISPSCFNTPSISRSAQDKHPGKLVSREHRTYNDRNIGCETSDVVNQLSRSSKRNSRVSNGNLSSLKVSIDLNKIRNVINDNIACRAPRQTNSQDGDLKTVVSLRSKLLEQEIYSPHKAHKSEESKECSKNTAQSLSPVSNDGQSLRRSNRHFEKHCFFDR